MRPTLRSTRQFEAVYARGRKHACSVLVLFHLDRAADTRVAYVASRKVGGAVQRNRAKRVLRAALAQVDAAAPELLRGWMVLVARRDILALSSREVAAELQPLLAGSAPRERRPADPTIE
jgi:ribonuclease P protein component